MSNENKNGSGGKPADSGSRIKKSGGRAAAAPAGSPQRKGGTAKTIDIGSAGAAQSGSRRSVSADRPQTAKNGGGQNSAKPKPKISPQGGERSERAERIAVKPVNKDKHENRNDNSGHDKQSKPDRPDKPKDTGAKPAPAKSVKAPEKPHRAVHTDINAVRRNARSIRTLKRVMAVLIVLLIGIVIYITYPDWSPKLEGLFDRPVRTVFNDGDTEGGRFPLEPDNTIMGVYAVKNNLMTTDLHTITFYDVNGEKKASYNHNFSKPVVRTAGKRVLVFDSGAYGFKMYKKGGETYSKTLDNTILTGDVSEDGISVIVTTSDKYASAAKFFDKDGKLIFNYDCTSRIVSVSLTEDGSSCYVCTFSQKDGEIVSQIRRIDLDKSGEQLVSDDLPAIAVGCVRNSSGDIMAVCDTAFYVLGADGKVKSQYEYNGELTSFALDASGAAVLINGNTRKSGRLMIAQAGAAGASTFRELTSDSPVKAVRIFGDRAVLLGSEKAYAFDFTATLTATAEIGREYGDFTYIDSALYLLGKHGVDKIKFEM